MKADIFSFFSGAGFLDLGFEKAGFEIVQVNEIHPPFMRCYKHSRLNMGMKTPRHGYAEHGIERYLEEGELDTLLSKIQDSRNKGRFVGFIGGPPCPDFSIAGKQAGRNGKNGQLSDIYVSLICAAKPDFFLFENVRGLVSTKKHREYYNELKARLAKSGYSLIDRLCNALEFGAPQDRERIILIGVFKETLKKEVHDFDFLISAPNKNLLRIKGLPWPEMHEFSENSTIPCPYGIDKTLTVEHWFRKNEVESHPKE